MRSTVGSHLEETFAAQLQSLSLPRPEREFRFNPSRKWRADFAWPSEMLIVEVDGGTHTQGRHVRAEGFRIDCEKHNSAVMLGWRVLRGDAKMVKSGDLAKNVEHVLKLNKQDVELAFNLRFT